MKGVITERRKRESLGWPRLWRRGSEECNFTCPNLAPTWRTALFSDVQRIRGSNTETGMEKILKEVFQYLGSATSVVNVIK